MNKIRELVQELVIDYVDSDIITLTVDKLKLKKVLKILKETKDLQFNQLTDLCAVDHILSMNLNMRIRVKCNLPSDSLIVPSVTDIYASADWYEREAYDLFGVLFEGHKDLRRILTDYGFIGHPFRKKFPLIGNTQVTYDPEQKKVINVPVDISPRTLVPKVIRKRK